MVIHPTCNCNCMARSCLAPLVPAGDMLTPARNLTQNTPQHSSSRIILCWPRRNLCPWCHGTGQAQQLKSLVQSGPVCFHWICVTSQQARPMPATPAWSATTRGDKVGSPGHTAEQCGICSERGRLSLIANHEAPPLAACSCSSDY